jgi:hypothetical protein
MPEGQEHTTPAAGTKVGRKGGKPDPFGSLKDLGWRGDRDITAMVSFLVLKPGMRDENSARDGDRREGAQRCGTNMNLMGRRLALSESPVT